MPYFDYASIFLIIITILVVLFLFYLLYIIYKLFNIDLSLERKVIETKAHKKAISELEKARKEAMTLLSEAKNASKAMIENTNVFSDSLKNELENSYKSSLQRQLKTIDDTFKASLDSFKKDITEQQTNSTKVLEEFKTHIKSVIEQEITTFTSSVTNMTNENIEHINKTIEKSFEKVEADLSKYKEARAQEIDKELKRVAATMIEDLIGKSLDLNDQESLLIKSLEEANTEEVFK